MTPFEIARLIARVFAGIAVIAGILSIYYAVKSELIIWQMRKFNTFVNNWLRQIEDDSDA